MFSKSDGKQAVWSGYGHKATKIVRKKFWGRLVRMRSAVQIRPAAPKILENLGFRGFFVAKSRFTVWVKNSDPHRDPRRHKFQITRFTQAGKAHSFHCASVSKRDPLRWARVWRKDHRTGRSAFPSGFLLPFFSYMTCPRTLPMVWAASSCFCRVAWVYVRRVNPAS